MLLQRKSAAFQALLLLFMHFSRGALGFNLDTSHVIRKDGEPGSLFGLSLALHRQIDPDKIMLLIGSPRARALNKQASRITGGLYKCELDHSSDCERVEFDNEEDKAHESKEDQWMGVTVQSQGPGGKILTCAHRYQKRMWVNSPLEVHTIPGRCYVLSQDLTINPFSAEDGGNWNLCEGRVGDKDHEKFGVCQQGLAATFTRNYHYLMFGAPGAYNWQGTVNVDQKNETFPEIGIYVDGPYEVEEMKNVIPANSYLGFSLDSGHRITKSRELTVVAGAPRANHSGVVFLFKNEKKESGRLLTEHIFRGTGLASSFGYDVAVVDLNSDGWEDIVVGAPHFYMKDKDIGGAVYVYINKAGLWESVSPVRLNGNKDSMFGLAVKNIGDINQDSYNDIAIGAPQDDGGAGRVYIHHGSQQGIRTSPAQVLSGKEHNIRLFGYSLAGNMDLDGNFYPDLAVGSLSDSAFIYRARPVITITRDIRVSPNKIDLRLPNCENSFCLIVHTCFTYAANPLSYSPRLTISYSIEADGNRRKQGLTSRIKFLNETQPESDNMFNGTIDLRGRNQLNCIQVTAKLKDNIKDKLRSIPIEVSAEIIAAEQQKSKNGLPWVMPILDVSHPSKDTAEVNFVKEGCRDSKVCHSKLKMEYSLFYKQSSQDVFLPLTKSKNNIPEFHLNYEKKDLALQVIVTNTNGDDAYEAKLVGKFPETLSYSGVRSITGNKQIICESNQNGSQAECELGNPFKRNSKIAFYIILSTLGINLNTNEFEINLQLQTTSDQSDLFPVKVRSKVIIEIPLSVSGEAKPNQVSFGGVVKGESAMKTEEEIGSLIHFTFRINNLWTSLHPSVRASLLIHWPKSNKDGKWLLYLVKVTSRGPEKVVCSPESEINSLKLTQSKVPRAKRETVTEGSKSGAKLSFLTGRDKVLSCETLKTGCVVLECPLQGLDGTEVELSSRLWNSTFIEEFASFPTVRLAVKASLKLHNQAQNVILGTPNTIVKVDVSPDSSVAQYGGVPWWIILVAVLAGISILALMVFLLWKCGFFRRSKKDDSVPRYHAVRIKKETPQQNDGEIKLDAFDKKQWMTTWIDNESYS
ncbi:integrin alpha-6 isoform X1 [Nothobranchius furzeri]|uniref:Integrin, alpha 6a n=5 Tax=Nothobranchius TaxID=28779 RepID=A0A8C6Q0H6_NOTFU|nr:integrin alpha-6 isoform X1 [Nothobranchius furzeri]KAF7215846.1 transcript variant X1 [Nothobranchius furzeri]